jgi:hypothetical protein
VVIQGGLCVVAMVGWAYLTSLFAVPRWILAPGMTFVVLLTYYGSKRLLSRLYKQRWLDITPESIEYFEEEILLWQTNWRDIKEFYSSESGCQLVCDDGKALNVRRPIDIWNYIASCMARPGSVHYATSRGWRHGPWVRIVLSLGLLSGASLMNTNEIGALPVWMGMILGALILTFSAIVTEFRSVARIRLPNESLVWTKGPTSANDMIAFKDLIVDQVRTFVYSGDRAELKGMRILIGEGQVKVDPCGPDAEALPLTDFIEESK